MRTALIACLALGLTACANTYQHRDQRTGPSVKIVDAKRPPATLYAVDRSVCLVTPERYRNIRIGDAVYCNWSGGRDPVAGWIAPPGADERTPGTPRGTVPGEQQQ